MTKLDTQKYLSALAAVTHRALKGNKLVMILCVDEDGDVAVAHAPSCGPECTQKNVCAAQLYEDMGEILLDEAESILESNKQPTEGLPT